MEMTGKCNALFIPFGSDTPKLASAFLSCGEFIYLNASGLAPGFFTPKTDF